MLDDLSIASYQPPALYFNSNSDFLQMMTPRNARVVHEAKENRLSYLASIPIGDFDDGFDDDDDDDDEENAKRHPPERMKPKGAQSVRFNLASSSSSPPPLPPPEIILRTRVPPKPSVLTQDFLHSFPLLRALVEEALTLQQQSHDAGVPMPLVRAVLGERPRSAGQQGPRKLKPSPTRPKTAMMVRQTRTKSVIVPRNINNTRRLYPPPPDARQMVVTKSEVRSLVDRLSKPKFNKRLEQELLAVEQPPAPDEPIVTPRTPPKPASARVRSSLLAVNHLPSLDVARQCREESRRAKTASLLRHHSRSSIVRRVRSSSSRGERTAAERGSQASNHSAQRRSSWRAYTTRLASAAEHWHSLALLSAEQSRRGHGNAGTKQHSATVARANPAAHSLR